MARVSNWKALHFTLMELQQVNFLTFRSLPSSSRSLVSPQMPGLSPTLGCLPEVRVAESQGKKPFKSSEHLEAEDIEIFDGEGEELDMDTNELKDGLTDAKAQDFH